MERRLFVTLLACFLFTIVYFRYIDPPPERPVAADGTRTVEIEGQGTAPGPTGVGEDAETRGAGAAGADEFALGEPVEIPPFDSDLLRVELTNRGAGLRQVYLKQYTRTAGDDPSDPSSWVTLFPDPLPSEPADRAAALMLREATVGDAAGPDLSEIYWEVVSDEEFAEEDGASGIPVRGRRITFRAQGSRGVIEKVLTLRDDAYHVDVEIRSKATADGPAIRDHLVTASLGIPDVPRGWFTEELGAPAAVAMQRTGHDVQVYRHRAEALIDDPDDGFKKGVSWAGCANLYFLALLEPQGELDCDAELAAETAARPEFVRADVRVPLSFPRDGSERDARLRLYLGPKDPRLMEARGYESFLPLIEEDYGWSFRWVNKLLLAGLRLFERFVGNWGLAIIMLTLLVRLLIFPITRMQQVSMQTYAQKMQVLKPKLDALKQRYKNNPQKFAQEQMKLLKEHQARPPLFGCLSMFITFPVFIGMFQLLRTAIELRQAPFAWIADLSLPDALFSLPGGHSFNLLPILATAAFVVQMALAPKPADPQARQQQKIMMFMPIVFGVMFYGYAAGLSLYMLTTSMYSIFETQFIRKKFFPAPVPAAASAGARARA